MPVAELRIPSDPAYVGLARLVVAQAARQAGVASDRVQDVKIAVDEALANVVRAQAALGSTTSIDVSFGVVERRFEIIVQTREVPLTAVDVGGEHEDGLLDPKLSFTLIEGLTDEMTYEPEASTMRLRFVIGVE